MIKALFSTTLKTYLIFQLITRTALSLYAYIYSQVSLTDLPLAFTVGALNDLVSASYFLPVIVIFNLFFSRLASKYKFFYSGYYLFYFICVTSLIFIAISEVAFWDEFGTRFNFIAVDYLIYTHEIIGTVKESLPYVKILSFIIILAVIITFFMRKILITYSNDRPLKNYPIYIAIVILFNFASFYFYDPSKIHFSNNKYALELGKNGPYEFFSAFFNNSLDYNKFYPKIDPKRALEVVQNKLKNDQNFINSNSIEREIEGTINQKKYNVIFITVESLSSKFLGSFGSTENITPYLDKTANESLFFTNIYAAGTRTVRGLEAITLSVPPTPGSSIIRRPDNQNLFNIGTIFKNEGYEINFIFGGYSYFDNFQNYFEGNGYNIIDRNNLKSNEISFSNIWGVADEDIFAKALESADQNYQDGKNFFSLIMTTSNHRPYSFPEGRIDLPSGNRSAAVKYTDYAIGRFLEQAQSKPWFYNTIFIITADHCAASAGKTDLPVDKYHIPLIIYAPKILKPQKIDSLASQIDIAPTLLGLLGFKYKSKFWGQDILLEPPNRAFISTYQLLGYMKNDYLVILSPNSKAKTYKLIAEEKEETQELLDLTEEAISFYQTAYDFYISGKMRE